MRKIAYLSIDVHAHNCVLRDMDANGKFRGNRSFITSALKAVKAKKKYLVMEAGPMSNWAAQVASDHVTQAIICDPRENALIYKGSNKRDKVDTKKLCRLLRLGEFKAKYRQWGVIDVFTDSVYSVSGRAKFLNQLQHHPIKLKLKRLYDLMEHTAAIKQDAEKSMQALGRSYPEIKEFKKMPGMGPIGAHTFDAYIQTPLRFAKRSRFWRYCRLAVTDRSSDGKPLGFKRLDKAGVGELKALSYRAFLSATKSDNEVKRFYLNSLRRTHDRRHDRLNTWIGPRPLYPI